MLEELGVLIRSERSLDGGPSVPSRGEHVFSPHTPLWVYENPHFTRPMANDDTPLYEELPPETTPESALGSTRFLVLLGAESTETLLRLAECRDHVLMIFEPDERVLDALVAELPKRLLTRGGIFATGDTEGMVPPMQELLPEAIFDYGFPVFFQTERIQRQFPEWAAQVIEYLELLFYRNKIYPVSGQGLMASLPIREISRGLFYDQQVHAYENIAEYFRWPDIGEIRARFAGETAILVAAGPELSGRLDYIRRNMDRAVVICVNNAVKPLLEAGIKPHIVVINDTSLASGEVFSQIEKAPGTVLVGHCLADLGGDRFRCKYLFGSFLPELFGKRPMLRLHGSVISTAFSMAEHLGCSRCVIVGAQLGSDNPWGLGYAKGTVHENSADCCERPLINRHPQLYPVTTPHGETVYTTLNFRDAALWLSETIRVSGIECVNTSRSSLLFGAGIAYDSEPVIEKTGHLRGMLGSLHRQEPPRINRGPVAGYIRKEMSRWDQIREAVEKILAAEGEPFLAMAVSVLQQLDRGGVTYLVERAPGFSNAFFYEKVFESSDPAEREEGFCHYFKYVRKTAGLFSATLARQLEAIRF